MENRDGQAYQLPGRFDNKGDIHNEEDDLVLGSALVAELDAIAAESQRIARWTAKEDAIIRRYGGSVTIKGLIRMLEKATGVKRSFDAVEKHRRMIDGLEF